MTGRTTKLDSELLTFDAHRAALLQRARGGYVLVKGDRVIGTFDTFGDALRRGYEEFGPEPFLVKQILDVDMPQTFTSIALAV